MDNWLPPFKSVGSGVGRLIALLSRLSLPISSTRSPMSGLILQASRRHLAGGS